MANVKPIAEVVSDLISHNASAADIAVSASNVNNEDAAGAALAAANALQGFASPFSRLASSGTVLGPLALANLGYTAWQVNNDWNKHPGHLSDPVYLSAASSLTAVLGMGAALAGAPIAAGLAVVAATGLAIYGLTQSDESTAMYDTAVDLLNQASDLVSQLGTELSDFFESVGNTIADGVGNFIDFFGNEFLELFAPDGLKPSDRNGPLTFGIGHYVDRNTNTGFNAAQTWTPPRIDPLALDLDGDGIETVGIGDWNNTVLFDHDGDGQKAGTGWLSGDDGWLVRDLNGNGTIDDGTELFGDNTRLADGTRAPDGFAALADLDSNQDGVIDANDAAFGELKVWQDANQDGISQAGELKTLSELGIASISPTATVSGQAQNGNTIDATATFTRTDGSTGAAGTLGLAASRFFTDYGDAVAGDASLPEMHGSGAVRNLGEGLLPNAA